MKHAALLGVGVFLLTSLAVGVRLLILYRHTRKLPELLMAVALLCTGFIAFAAGTAGKLLIEGTPDLRFSLSIVGVLIEHTGQAALALFAWHVFRRQKRSGVFILVGLGALAVSTFVGEVWSGEVIRYTDSEPISGPWLPLGLVSRGLPPLWLAVECLRFYAQLRRRVRIGLAEPLVTQRVGLWGLAMVASTGCYITPIAHRLIYGTGVREHLWAISTVSGLAMTTAICLWLAFFPPRAYRARMTSLPPSERG